MPTGEKLSQFSAKNGLASSVDELCTFQSNASEILTLDKRLSDNENNSGVTLAENGYFEEAKAAFLRALKYDPENYDAIYNLGLAYENLNDFRPATETYCLYLEKNPQGDKSEELLKLVSNELNSYPGFVSETAFRDFDSGNTVMARAKSNKDLKKALNFYDSTITIHPRWADAYFNRAIVKEGLLDYEGARKDLVTYVTLTGDSTENLPVQGKISQLSRAEPRKVQTPVPWEVIGLIVSGLTYLIIEITG